MTVRHSNAAWTRRWLILLIAAVATTSLVATPRQAHADDDVLANSPMVRRQLMPRAGRHEVAGVFGMSLADPYVRNFLPGVRYDWHLFDWLSVGARLQFGIPFTTALFDEIDTKVGRNNQTFEMEASTLQFLGMAHVSVSPLVGKFLVFASLPVNFDVHFDVMAGVVNTGSTGTNIEPAVEFAGGFGGGVRVFLSRVLALSFDLQAVGVDRPLSINRDSKEVPGTFAFSTIFNVGVSFFMPPELTRGE